MGFLDFLRRRPPETQAPPSSTNDIRTVAVGAKESIEELNDIQAFNNANITFSGELAGYNYDALLRDKQANIFTLYQLADYYCDKDPLVRGIIRHMYVPFTLGSSWCLTGTTEKTRQIYEDFYKSIRLREKLSSFILQYWKYGNVFIYVLNGVPISLPVSKCRIGNVSFNGDPIVDFDCQSVYNEWRNKRYVIKENWIKDNHIEEAFKGYPPEVREALNRGEQYAQLNPKYCKVLQMEKEDWQRYAVPFITACLSSLDKKDRINKYELAQLELGIHSFVHVTYGDPKQEMLPEINQLRETRSIFSRAMNNYPLAVTNYLAKATVVQPDLDNLFQFDKYHDVNNDILSAGGISGILVSGVSEDGSTFASAQVSVQTAAARIEACRDEICELMRKVNICIQEELATKHRYHVTQIPEFSFLPLDMSGKKALREACQDLWQNGLVSTQTLMLSYGYSIDKEKELREREAKDGTDEILVPREVVNARVTVQDEPAAQPNNNEETRGRKALTDEERNSDPDAAMRGKQPKPSNPEGSMDDGGIT